MPREALWPTYRPGAPHLLVGLGVLADILLMGLVVAALTVSFLQPQSHLGDPNARILAGNVSDFAVGEPVFFEDGRFWLVRLDESQFVAYSAADSFRGCTVAWRPDFSFRDTRDGVEKEGWFRDLCHGSIYDIHGVKVQGPSPRNLDTYPIEVVGNQVIVHATSRHLVPGSLNPAFQPSER